MSKKSTPGDGSHNCGVKGGKMYAAHFDVPAVDEAEAGRNTGFIGSVVAIARGISEHRIS